MGWTNTTHDEEYKIEYVSTFHEPVYVLNHSAVVIFSLKWK